jgi:Raf kinase inhibitor-like YbhB/YbcL family protein
MRFSVRRGAVCGRSKPVVASLALLLAGSLLGGCGLLGKPQPLSADAPLTMTVTSPDFENGVLPPQYTCYNRHHPPPSPPIFWSQPPRGTKSMAIVVDDSAAPISPWVYWMVFDIGPDTTDLQPGALPPHARVAYNSAGTARYDAPCPVGSPHDYRFTVYALNTFLGSALPQNPQLLSAWTSIAKHVIARGTLTVVARPGNARPRRSDSGSASSQVNDASAPRAATGTASSLP